MTSCRCRLRRICSHAREMKVVGEIAAGQSRKRDVRPGESSGES